MKEATTFREGVEGYNLGDATAELVVEIPNEIITDIGWPSDEVLGSCGANILAEGPSRVIEIGSRRFCGGIMESMTRTLDDDNFEALRKGRPNKTDK